MLAIPAPGQMETAGQEFQVSISQPLKKKKNLHGLLYAVIHLHTSVGTGETAQWVMR